MFRLKTNISVLLRGFRLENIKQPSRVEVIIQELKWFPGRLPVIGCPFLGEGEPVLLDLVLGLQRACNLLKKTVR